ncbi:hypothetical protein CUMW_241410 [Citrus unshiu]|uniref:Leucine-rich repeat-containing N-terminal plant-type domain-containing protein n=1 Tax=Citrus unshiu TaxID=55188 RepID=A0A2H5QLK7_CITUN|nr:hypothetical protein CUMW_241410 [Citrus unshiu]
MSATTSSPAISLNKSSCSLRILDFSHNYFRGHCQLPSGLGNFSKLQTFRAGFSYLSGSIPGDVSAAASLEDISLPVNQLSGAISNGVVNLTSLNIGKLANLKSLKLHTNSLSGFLPQFLMNCTNLITLNLRINNFRGDLSAYNFSTLHNLHTIDLGNNNFTGSFPLTLTSCMFLTAIRLSGNKIEEQISPTILALLTKLEGLDFSENNLHGKIPLSLVDLHFLSSFSVANNDLQGQYHQEVSFIRFQAPALKGIQDCVRHNSCDFIHPRTDVWDWPNESSNNELHYGIIAGVVLDSSLDL